MYNRYLGNSGRVIRVEEAAPRPAAPVPPPAPPPPGPPPPPPEAQSRHWADGLLSGMQGELGRLLGRLLPARMETEDLLLLLILYLLYRESRDEEFLFMLAGVLLL
jgi:hypothetical protein